MKYAGDFGASQAGQSSIGYVDFDLSSQRGDPVAFTVSDAHLLFSGSYERHGRDLIISDQKHHLVVPNYFHGDKRPWLVSPDGAPLDSAIVDALTGHTQYAQAGGSPAGKVVGNIAKMTGSASIVRNGVTIDVQVGDAVYQSDVLQTGSSSTVGLVLVDGTAFNLSANARLMLNDLTFEEGSTSNSSFITLVQGAASFVAGQVAKTGDMKVATPAAVVGIRGTAVKLDIASTDGRVDISVIDQQDGQVHAVEVFKCVPTGVTDPQTGATCSAGDRIGTVTSNGPSLSVTPAPNFDVTVQQNNKTPAQIAQEFNVFQATIETYNIQKQINPNLPQHTENGGGNNSNTGTKYASLGSTPPDPPATDSFAEGKGLAVQALVTDLEIQAADTVPATGRVVTSVTVPAVSTSSSTANNAGTDSPLTLPLNTAAPQVTARLAFNTGTSTDIIASNNATLSGTGLANTAVNFTVDGSPIATTVMADANGVWSFTPSGLADGAHTIVASQTDGFGNTGAASLSFTLDTTAPSGGMPNLEASDTGSSSSDNITAATTPIFVALLSTSVVAGDSVELLLNGSPLPHPEKHLITSADVLAGRVSLAVTPGDLGADGSKEVATQFSDTAGNSSISSALSFTLDTLAPAAPAITSVTDDVLPVTGALTSGGSTNDTDLTVRVSLSGTNAVAGDTLQLYNGTGTSSQLGTSYTITSGDISNGFADVQTGALSNGATYTITARVTDQAGNQSTASGSFIITEAGTAPAAPAITSVTDDVLPVTGTVADNGFSNGATLTIAGTAEAGSTVTLYDTDGTTVLGTGVASGGAFSITTTALGQGSHTITAKATDTAGNQGAASTAYHVTIDTSAPAEILAITSIAGSSSPNVATITISGSNGALVNADKVQISGDDGVTWTDVVQTSPTNWTFADNVTRIANFNYRARIIDIAGNVGVTITQPVLVANNGGTISVVGPSSALVAKFTGTAGGTLQLGPSPGITGTVNAISIASGLIVISGNASITSGTGDAIDLTATGGTQGAPANLSINLTGPITGAASGVAAVQNAYGSITVNTSGPVIGLAGRGIYATQSATGVGSILVNVSGNVTGTGTAFSGIVAQNLNTANNADVTVAQTGNVTGGHDGIRAQTNGNGNVTVTTGANATITGITLYGIEAYSNGQGNITVTTASGDFINSGSVGINAYNQATSIAQAANSFISVTANGIINSGATYTGGGGRPAGILAGYKGGTTNTANSTAFGNVTVDNFATINAAGGDGIRAYNFGPGNVTIANHATIVARDFYGIAGSSSGSGNVVITTMSGSSITSGSHGILAINQATAIAAAEASTVTVTTASGDTINSGVHLSAGGAQPSGISAGYFGNGASNPNINGSVFVDNAANISARAGTGIAAFHFGYGNLSIIDRTGTSVSGAQFGISVGSSVSGTASPSNMSINVEGNATVMAGSLYGLAAISANNPTGGNTSISTGSGDVIRSGGTGINANVNASSTPAASTITITTQQGTITSGYNFFQGGGTPSGISAGYNGPLNTAVRGNVVLDNSATVKAVSGAGISLNNNGVGSITATLQAGSSVTGAQSGVNAFSAGGGNITVDNRGTITAGSIGINTGNGGSNPSSANGQISVINSGTVTGPGAPYMSVVSIGNVNSSQTATVGNGGTIAAGLFARTTNNVAISIYSGNGAITNSGTITGNVAFNANGNFTNAIGGIWNLNGWNNLGTGAPAINNAGTMNVSGWAFLSANGGPVALSNTSAINVAQNSVAQIFANVSGAGTISIGDRSAVEIGGSVAASQGFNIFGRGLLTFDNPASVGSNLPLNFTSSANGNLGSIISLIGGGISAANIAGSTLTVTGAFQSYLFQLSGSGVSGNYFDVLSSDRIILVPTTATIISNVTTSQSPATPANFYILDNDHIGGSGPGFNLQTNDAVATSAYTIVANANSDISVNGSNISGLRVATQGASGTIINAANVTTTGAGPTSGIVVDTTLSGNNFNGSADIVNYGNVSGVTNAIVANTVNGNVNIVTGFATLTGTNSYGIFGRASGSGGINIMTAGGTINAGLIGIAAFEAQMPTGGAGGNVTVYNSSNITSGTNTANLANSGAAGIRAGILNNNTLVPNAAITGDVTIENRANITAQAGAGLYAYNLGSGNTSVTFAPGQYSITAVNGGVAGTGTGLTQYGIFAFNYGAGSSLVNAGWGTTITSGSTGINAGNQATAIASGSGSTVSVYSQGFISSGTNVNNGGSAQSAIQAGYNPGGNGQFSSAVYGDVIVNVASDFNPFGNPNPTLLAAAGPGILAYDFGVGHIAVSIGSGVSIQALTAATASGGGNAPYGIAATNRGSGNIVVTTSGGSSINSGSTGINAVNDANPTAGSDLANLFAANVAAGKPAVIAVTAAGTINSGSQSTNSNGTPSGIAAGFSGSSGQANQYVSGNVFINNAAVITAAGYGLQGYNFGYGNITINDASGANITAGSHGIYAHADGGFTDPITASALTRDIAVNVYQNTTIIAGTASSTAYGILALSTNAGSISVITATGATIDSHLGGAGINAVNEATSIASSFNSSVVVTNAATIHSGSGLIGFNNQPAGILAGYIGGTSNPSPGNLANYNVIGEVVVNNFGNITADAGDGIRAYSYGVGSLTANDFGGHITALGGASPPNGSGIGILAQTYGPGNVRVTTSAGTTITSGGSGIAALNKAISADPANPPVVVPSTSEVSVLAFGTIHSGTIPTATVANDPAAGILAGYNPNNTNTPNNNVHGNVSIDDYATILAPAGTDGIRGVNYGTGNITVIVESGANISAGRYGVAALGYNGGNVSITNSGLVTGSTYAVNATTTSSGTAVIDNFGHLVGNATGYNATFTNEIGGDWSLNGASVFTGTSTLVNAGLIDSNGVSAISGLSSITNTGTFEVQSGSLTLGGPMTGAGTVVIYGATMEFGGASDANVQFTSAASGTLVLDDASHFTGTVTGFSFGDTIYLAGIAPANVSVTSSGSLHVSYGAGSVNLIGNYDPAGFTIASDGGTGTNITWNHQTPVILTNNMTTVANLDGTTKVLGLQVTDTDPAASSETFNFAATTGAAASGTSITPSSDSGSLTHINSLLESGVTYQPGGSPPATDMMTLTVTDSFGATDSVHFVFNQVGSGPNNTLQGTSGKDVILATNSQDVLTGGAGQDQFLFAPTSSGPTVQHTITDFEAGIDKLDVRQFSGLSGASIPGAIQQQGSDTLITLDAHDTLLLKNVFASSVHSSDFIVHS